jgi:hypothetical protein
MSVRFTGCSHMFSVDSAGILPVSYRSGRSTPAAATTQILSATAIMSPWRSLFLAAIVCPTALLTAPAQALHPAIRTSPVLLVAPRPLLPDTTLRWIRTRPIFVWTSVPGAVSYVLQVTQDSSFGPSVQTDTLGTDTVAVSPRLLVSGSRYCWRVGAVDAAGRSTFSDSVWCATGPLPSARSVRLPDSRRDEENTAFH